MSFCPGVRSLKCCVRYDICDLPEGQVDAGQEKMANDLPDDPSLEDGLSSAAAQEANGIAFLLASAAYLMLADAYLCCEGASGLALIDEIEVRLAEATQSFVAEHPFDVARPDIILRASQKIRELLDAGRNLLPGASSRQ